MQAQGPDNFTSEDEVEIGTLGPGAQLLFHKTFQY